MSRIDNPSGIPDDELHREGLIDRLQQYLEAEPKAWHIRYNLGVALMHSDRVDEAVAEFNQVLAQAPKHMESLINLGGIHLSRGEGGPALKAFTKALSVHEHPLVRANLAVAYMQLGHMEEAERELKQALAMHQEMPDAWANLGSCYLQQDRLDEAVEASQKALDLREDFAVAHNNLAVALMDLDREDEAKAHAQRALDLDYPVHAGLLERLGLAPA